jgi:hypothetical protein
MKCYAKKQICNTSLGKEHYGQGMSELVDDGING